MRWEDEPWVKIYTRNHPEWLSLSWQARGLFCLLIREVDRAGILRLGRLGLRGIAVSLSAPWVDIEAPVRELIADGCIRVEADESTLLVPNFLEAQAAKQSDRARKQRSRDTARARFGGPVSATDTVDSVTERDQVRPAEPQAIPMAVSPVDAASSVVDTKTVCSESTDTNTVTKRDHVRSQNVTNCHVRSHAVTRGHTRSRAGQTAGHPNSGNQEPPCLPAVSACMPANSQVSISDGTDVALKISDLRSDQISEIKIREEISENIKVNIRPLQDLFGEDVPPNDKTETRASAIRALWDRWVGHWTRVVGGNNPPKLDDKRRKLARARLADFPVADLEAAIDGIWASAWHVEQGQVRWELAFRDSAHVERFRAPPKQVTVRGRTGPGGRHLQTSDTEYEWEKPGYGQEMTGSEGT